MSVTISAGEFAVHERFGVIVDTIDESPELNLSNANFRTLFSALGFDPIDAGEIDTMEFRQAIERFDPVLVERAGHEEARTIDFGIHIGQATNYAAKLRDVVRFAIRRGGFIRWA